MIIKPDEPVVVAKKSQAVFSIRNNTYVVPLNGLFHYFPCEVVDPDPIRPILRFLRSPPVIRAGYAIFDRQVYEVSVEDLLRRVVRKSKLVNVKKACDANGNLLFPTAASLARLNLQAAAGDIATAGILGSTDQPALGDEAWLEDAARADLAWTEQVGALLDTLSEEEGEGWEIED